MKAQLSTAPKELPQLMALMQKSHYSPPKMDDNFSRNVFRRFLLSLDPYQLYFTAGDMEKLAPFKTKLDEEMQGKSWNFIHQISELYVLRLEEAKVQINEILAKEMDYDKEESLSFGKDTDSIVYPTTEAERKVRWEKWLKYKLLDGLVSKMTEDKKWSDIIEEESKLKEKIKKSELQKVNRFLEGKGTIKDQLTTQFLGIVTYSFDPHSEYMSFAEMTEFKEGVSKGNLIFGFQLKEEDNGNIVIEQIAPGSAAWKSNALHKGDIILEVKNREGDVLQTSDAELSEISQFLDAEKGKIQITIKQKNGLKNTVILQKEQMEDGENAVKSFILKGDKTIGYISLPGFYTDWTGGKAASCANDVAKEIIKLKQENIDGLIIDVRYNGGGDMEEGIEMVGIFVNEGPISMLKDNKGKVRVLKDPNRGMVYDGPLLVMINGQSASASELFAAGLQDYNRALIVGSTTWGKGSAQVIRPIDSTQMNNPNAKCSFVKVSIEKFYRINQESNQLIGVKPHIHLPDVFESLDYSERYYKHAFPNDKVAKVLTYTPLAPISQDVLVQKSAARLENKAAFQYIMQVNKDNIFQEIGAKKPVSLNKKTFLAEHETYTSAVKQLETLTETATNHFKIENSAANKQLLQVDVAAKEINEQLVKSLSEDVYIEECYEIMKDYIQTLPK